MTRSFATIVSLLGLLGVLAAFAFALTGSPDEAPIKQSTTSFSDALVPTGAYAISADFKTLAQFNDGAIELVSLPSRKVTRRLRLPEGKCAAIVMSDDGQWLAASLPKRRVAVWDLKTGKEKGFIQVDPRLYKIEFVTGKPHLWIDDRDRTFWDVSGNALVKLPPKRLPYQYLVFSKDGKYAAGRDYTGTGVFELATEEKLTELPLDMQNPVSSLAFSPDSQLLAVGGARTARLWFFHDDKTKFLDSPNGHNVTFSPDGSRLYVSGQSGIHVFDVKSRKRIVTAWPEAWIYNFTISADGRQFSFRDRGFLYFRNIEQVLAHRLTREDVQSGKTWWPAACEPITRWPEFQAAAAYPIRALPNFDATNRYNSTPFTPTEEQSAAAIAEAQWVCRLINADETDDFDVTSAFENNEGRVVHVGGRKVNCSVELTKSGVSLSGLTFATSFLDEKDRTPLALLQRINSLLDTLCDGRSPWKFDLSPSNARGSYFTTRTRWKGRVSPHQISIYTPKNLSDPTAQLTADNDIQIRFPRSIAQMRADWNSLDSYSLTAPVVKVLPRALKTLEKRFKARAEDCTIAYFGCRLYPLSEFSGWARPTTTRFGADGPLLQEMQKTGGIAPLVCIDFWGGFMPARMCFHPETGELVALIKMYEQALGEPLVSAEDD
jgi:hypothetical protein